MNTRLIAALAAALGAFCAASANAEDKRAVEAGPIWNQGDAEQKCPALAAREGGEWTGGWWTTEWGKMSVCEIRYPEREAGIDPNAFYHLSTDFRGPAMRLDVHNGGERNNMVHLAPAGDYSGQFWKFTPASDGYYRITSMFRGDGMCLDVYNGGPRNNMPHLTECANYSGQFWRLSPAGGGRYRLTTMFRGEAMCLDIFNGGPQNNMPHLTECANYSGQFWALTPSGQ